MKLSPHPGGAETLWRADLAAGQVALAWLGQAGFAVRLGGLRMLIDPYLSDHLARKYAGQEFRHVRMMPPPLDADQIRDLDLVLCTHRHSDHMDYGCLSALAANNPACRFVVPRAELDSARKARLPSDRVVPVNDGDRLPIGPPSEHGWHGRGCCSRDREPLPLAPRPQTTRPCHPLAGPPEAEVLAIPSAHETLATDEQGNHRFLGYVLRLAGATLYHSGDCIVYPGLAQRLRTIGVDLALLPVNGRSPRLTARGIPGNMTFDEAVALCRDARIGLMIPHHFGMFDFNTLDPADLERQAARLDPAELQCVIPRVDRYYTAEAKD